MEHATRLDDCLTTRDGHLFIEELDTVELEDVFRRDVIPEHLWGMMRDA